MNVTNDAFGPVMVDALEGRPAFEIIERDDGYIEASRVGANQYLAPFRR